MKRLFLLFLFLLLSSPLVFSAEPENTNCDCSSETNTIQTELIIINQTLKEVEQNLTYYENQTDYYKTLYEDMNVTITNRELINIYNTLNVINANLTQINNRVDEIENKITLFSLEVGISVISLSVIGATLIELVIRWRRRRKSE